MILLPTLVVCIHVPSWPSAVKRPIRPAKALLQLYTTQVRHTHHVEVAVARGRQILDARRTGPEAPSEHSDRPVSVAAAPLGEAYS